jgi:predicted secreted hydrolase
MFPHDLGAHENFRNEWWYFTGNLDGENGERFGYELTFFRFSLTPAIVSSESAWRTNQVYIAHFAVTDVENEGFHVAQRYSRGGALELAGAIANPLKVWIDDWILYESFPRWGLKAQDDAFGIDVTFDVPQRVVLNGIDGLSQKSAEPGNASYYYSITRLNTEGKLRIGEREFSVSGLSWFDREWSTSALADDQVGWDWFALQLSDGTDLMYYKLRKKDSSQDPMSAGTWVNADGDYSHLSADDLTISVLDTWDSPEGGTYPSRWRLALAGQELELTVTPVSANQELVTTVRYWEGAVDVEGERDGKVITGRGYVELTGYAQ